MSYYSPTTEEAAARREALAEFDAWNARCLLATFALFGVPGHYLDLGCGTGVMVRTAQQLGAVAWGVDVAADPQMPELLLRDLTQPLHIDYLERLGADLITCIEVAEHLEAQYAPVLLNSIARHAAPGAFVVFTAAQPGQPGDHHVNCQPQKYWEALFYKHGMHAHREATLALALLWRYCGGPLSHHLPANLTVYHNGRGL